MKKNNSDFSTCFDGYYTISISPVSAVKKKIQTRVAVQDTHNFFIFFLNILTTREDNNKVLCFQLFRQNAVVIIYMCWFAAEAACLFDIENVKVMHKE